MNRNMVLAEWSRARQSLQAAETLTRDSLYADAVSRAYYSILHAAKAALHVHDIVAEAILRFGGCSVCTLLRLGK